MTEPHSIQSESIVKKYFGQSLPKVEEMVSNRVRRLSDVKYLHHYTDANGLLGILREHEFIAEHVDHKWPTGSRVQSLWATNVRYLNDTSELRHALELAENQISEYVQGTAFTNNSRNPDYERKFYRRLLAELREAKDYSQTFVGSFTEKANDLAQWRSYGKGIGGYSIGFRPVDLQNLADQQQFMLLPCIYCSSEQRDAMDELINSTIAQNHEFFNRFPGGWNSMEHLPYASMHRKIMTLASIFKNPGFEVENEWRVVYSPKKFDWPQKPIPGVLYRATPMGVTPYVQFRLRQLPIHELDNLQVWVGPSLETAASADAITGLLRSVKVKGEVLSSGIPFRQIS